MDIWETKDIRNLLKICLEKKNARFFKYIMRRECRKKDASEKKIWLNIICFHAQKFRLFSKNWISDVKMEIGIRKCLYFSVVLYHIFILFIFFLLSYPLIRIHKLWKVGAQQRDSVEENHNWQNKAFEFQLVLSGIQLSKLINCSNIVFTSVWSVKISIFIPQNLW